MTVELQVLPLNDESELSGFACGLASVDEWFSEKAWSNRHVVRTYICRDTDGSVVGCFALRLVVVHVVDYPNALRGGASLTGDSIGVLLAQMGVAATHQKNGLGKEIVRAAMTVAAEIHSRTPLQLFIVDAESPSLVEYYEKFGLRQIENTLRLAASMSKISRSLQ